MNPQNNKEIQEIPKNTENALKKLEKREDKLSLMEGFRIPKILEKAGKEDLEGFCFNANETFQGLFAKNGLDFIDALNSKVENPFGIIEVKTA